jgi:hypothetical protein
MREEDKKQRPYVPPKRGLIFKRQHNIMTKKIAFLLIYHPHKPVNNINLLDS